MFSVTEEQFAGPDLVLRAHLAPWDRPILRVGTAAITDLRLLDPQGPEQGWNAFRDWCDRHEVALVVARLAHDRIAESGFLEARGFRFIELNYRPLTTDLSRFSAEADLAIEPATLADQDEIRGIAHQIFEAGRLHLDPLIGPEIGNRRYAAWAENAFHHPAQRVMKCCLDGRIIAFFVVEQSTPRRCFWSLVGLAPGLAGQGLGRRVWQAMLARHATEGISEVETSISSHNSAAHNLYVSLGFRFPPPAITLHWCPRGPLRPS